MGADIEAFCRRERISRQDLVPNLVGIDRREGLTDERQRESDDEQRWIDSGVGTSTIDLRK